MIKYLLLSWWLILPLLAGNEVPERAYYFGFQDLEYWELPQQDSQVGDGSSAGADFEKLLTPVALSESPFKSQFIGESDELWDLTQYFQRYFREEVGLQRAVYNKTSGRVIVRGSGKAHSKMRSLAEVNATHLPRLLHIDTRFYVVPRRDLGVTLWDGEKIASAYQSLAESVLVTRVGGKSSAEMNGGALKITCEPNLYGDDSGDVRLSLNAQVGKRRVKVSTGICVYSGCPSVIELGGFGDENVLLLWIKLDHYLLGGVERSELVLDASGAMPTPRGKLREALRESEEVGKIIGTKTGRVLKRYQVSPTLMSFLDYRGGDAEGSSDPFAEEDAGAERPYALEYPVLKKWSPEIELGPLEILLDVSEPFGLHGVKLSEGDFIGLLEESSTLYVEASPENMELVEALLSVLTGGEPPKLVMYSIALVESDQKLEIAELENDEVRCLVKGGTICRPGQISPVELSLEGDRVLIEFEPNIGGLDDLLDMRGKFTWFNGEAKKVEWVSGVTLLSGEKQVLHSYRKGGKWVALVMEAKLVFADELALGEELRK